MGSLDHRAPTGILVVGVFAVALAGLGQLVVLRAVLSPVGAGDWVLFAVPALGLLGFVGIGTVLTAFMDR